MKLEICTNRSSLSAYEQHKSYRVWKIATQTGLENELKNARDKLRILFLILHIYLVHALLKTILKLQAMTWHFTTSIARENNVM